MNKQGIDIFSKFSRFISGGNDYNCLTWMDKMGSSTSAGNKSIPATSRCGVPIELVALLKNCLNFVKSENSYIYKNVTTKSGK